jgi:7-cyano-7-deazaguanine synthase
MAASLVLLSGGLDSATALAMTAREKTPCEALFVSYGQAADREELSAATAIARQYDVALETLRMDGLRFARGEIRGRNAFLLQSALLARQIDPTVVILAIHAGTAYVDCTPGFLDLMQRSFALQSGGEVTVAAPFIDFSKADIFNLACKIGVPIELTYSCELGGGPCNKCLSCRDRERLLAIT